MMNMARMLLAMVLIVGVASVVKGVGPLRVHPDNPRYFTDDSGRAILLTGSHTWNNLVDMSPADRPATFDYEAYLDWLLKHHHNFFRLWTWEPLTWDTRGVRDREGQVHRVGPLPFKRTGPGKAIDGKPKFDLRQFDDEYFRRLRDRVKAAQAQGLYPAVMLFEGWGIQFSPNGWQHHPFHPRNNVNGIDGDLDGDGKGLEVHSDRSKEITELQQAYVRKVVDTVNEFDNVLYEISNENHPESTQWQYAMIRIIKKYERTKPKQHPVGMTFQYKGGSNKTLFASPADWISPNREGGYRDNPPPADGSKVIVTDTDHLWGIGGNVPWVWNSFLRGLNPIFMDPYDGKVLRLGDDSKLVGPMRENLGYVQLWSQRVDLAAMTPQGDLASSRYCLANRGEEYLAYVPKSDKPLTLQLPAGQFKIVWFNTSNGDETKPQRWTSSGGKQRFTAPFTADCLLHLRRAE
jgi:hypothetical protein